MLKPCFSWFRSLQIVLESQTKVNQSKHLRLRRNSNTSLVKIEQDELHSDKIVKILWIGPYKQDQIRVVCQSYFSLFLT